MKCFVLLTVLVFASKNENDAESVAANSGEKIMENAEENSIVVKIEEDEYDKKKSKSSKHIGVYYNEKNKTWVATRWINAEKKNFNNGSYKDEETAAHASDTLARKLVANGKQNLKLNFPDDSTEVHGKKTSSSKFIGVYFIDKMKRWAARRWDKNEKKTVPNGKYKDEETAAHASDTLARKLMANDRQNLKLNFPDDNTEQQPEKTKTSKYFGVTYNEKCRKWTAQRWSKTKKKIFNNGYYKDEETAAHASDTMARKLMTNGDHNAKLNFPDDNTEEYPEEKKKTSKYFGVYDMGKLNRWLAQRYSKAEKKLISNGYYKDEESAAHASDTLARKLMANGEEGHKLNFPDETNEVHPEEQQNKRKRSFDFEYSQGNGKKIEKFEEKEK